MAVHITLALLFHRGVYFRPRLVQGTEYDEFWFDTCSSFGASQSLSKLGLGQYLRFLNNWLGLFSFADLLTVQIIGGLIQAHNACAEGGLAS